MFITFTIDTNQKKKSKVRLHKKRFNAASGWRRNLHIKKRNLWQKIKAWKRHNRSVQYKFGEQTVIF